MRKPNDLEWAITKRRAAANALKAARGRRDGTSRAKFQAFVRATAE